MTLFEVAILILGILLLGGIIFLVFNARKTNSESEIQRLMTEKSRLEAEAEQLHQKAGELKNAYEEISRLKESGKQAWAQNTKLEERNKALQEKLSEKERLISRFEEEKERREKEYKDLIIKLEHAKEKLEKEQARVIREDEEQRQKEQEERDRIWNEHENSVLARLREVCQKPGIAFQYYENTNLPADFDGTLKPDFLVEFLGQYLIFDAKKSKNYSTYINNQVKDTATKCKSNDKIYSTIFFVVPRADIGEVKKWSYFEDGFTFYVITEEALEPLLSNFKRITEYDKIQDFDPQDRENIVNLIANYDRHISFQNAANILLTKESVGLMNTKENLPSDFQEEIEIQKQNMRPIRLKESELKKISQNLLEQQKESEKLIAPKAAIEAKDLDAAQDSLL